MVDPAHGKLDQNWEGPYVETKTTRTGAYYLQDQKGIQIPNPWNITNLRKYYH